MSSSAPPDRYGRIGMDDLRDRADGAAASEIQVRCVHPDGLTGAQLALWRGFQGSSPELENPHFSPEFARLVAAVRPGAAIAVLEADGATVGFFPFHRRGRVGRPLAGGLDDCQAVVAAPGLRWDAPALVRGAGLSALDFSYVRASQRPFAPFHRRFAPSRVIDLAGGFDAYARERDAAGHKVLRQAATRARRMGKPVPLRFALHDPDPRSLRRLIELKRAQYRRNGVRDVFAYPWAVELVERIHATQGESFAGVLSTLSVGDRLVAAHMGMRSATVLHHWFPAYDTEFAKFSPGLILLAEMCRASAEAGIRAIELGTGEESYKPRFANAAIPTAAGFVGPAASLPALGRGLRYGVEDLAGRLPIGRFRLWPERLFRRLDAVSAFRR